EGIDETARSRHFAVHRPGARERAPKPVVGTRDALGRRAGLEAQCGTQGDRRAGVTGLELVEGNDLFRLAAGEDGRAAGLAREEQASIATVEQQHRWQRRIGDRSDRLLLERRAEAGALN